MKWTYEVLGTGLWREFYRWRLFGCLLFGRTDRWARAIPCVHAIVVSRD